MKDLGTLAAQASKATCLVIILAACNMATAYAQVVTADIPIIGRVAKDLTVNPVTHKVYFKCLDSTGRATICVLDEASDPLTVKSISTLYSYIEIGAINSVTNKIYAVYDNKIAVIDGATDTVSTTIILPFYLGYMAVNEKTNRIYVTFRDSNNNPFIEVIDGATNTLLTSIPTPNDPRIIKINPVTNKIYLTYWSLNTGDFGNLLSVVDGATDTIKNIDLYDSLTTGFAINTVTNKIFVTQYRALNAAGDGSVWVIDGNTDTIETARFLAQPAGYVFYDDHPVQNLTTGATIAVNETTNKVYMIANGVTVMDAATYEMQDIPGVNNSALNTSPTDIKVNPVLNKIYVGICCGPTLYGQSQEVMPPVGNYIAAIDGTTNLPSFITVPFHNQSLIVDPGTNRIYSPGGFFDTNYAAEITVFDASGGSIPSLSLFPPSLKFNTPLNTPSAPQTFWISNLGGAPMTITNIEANNIFYPAYAQSNNCLNPLPALTSCPVKLVYTPHPSPYNPQIGNLYVQTAAPTSPDRVTIDVTATVAPAP